MPYKDLEVRREFQRKWAEKYRKKNPNKVRENQRRFVENNLEHVRKVRRDYQRKRYAVDLEWRSKINEAGRKFYIKNRGRILQKMRNERTSPQNIARQSVHWSVKFGILKKPDSCSKCGDTRRIEGHHEDYSKPLEVIWLCSFCHRKLHRIKDSPSAVSYLPR